MHLVLSCNPDVETTITYPFSRLHTVGASTFTLLLCHCHAIDLVLFYSESNYSKYLLINPLAAIGR